ncbi:general odorant-binding protein 67-like [Sabethes cyaneus]|uniref:general odorant-binding protein 67-like n=1 Tax=Sabethes cyaneus TaxID=53552 RepID=UPI00237E0AE6|nr:general odorant-binding protein 67-like [Sabethes cyaneus]
MIRNEVLPQPAPDNPTCAEGNTKIAKDCCRLPSLVDQTIINRCATENPTIAPAPSVRRTEGCCIAQCVLITLNAFNNNTIDRTTLKNVLWKAAGLDRNFGPLLNNTIDECFTVIQNNPAFTATPVPSVPGRSGCSFLPEGFFNCVKSSLFQHCPAAVWNDNAECRQLKQKLSTGCSFSSLMG